IEEATGIIRTRAWLDREKVAHYHLVLRATDSSITEPKSTTTKLHITVIDENDNAPSFSQDNYIIYITDPTNPGDFVFGMEALDPDESINGRVTYYQSGRDADKFYINQETGVIKASQALTGDKVYELELRAKDLGIEAKW
ncbi:unnamed protein product, partial [Meganyctiphanes norvegica]